MAAKLEKTRTPGVYKRGGRYVLAYRDQNGKQRWESSRTYDEARRKKKARDTDAARGDLDPRPRISLRSYAVQWVDRYQGTGRRGFREETRGEYRALLNSYALRYFPPGLMLAELTPRMVADFIGWLVHRPNGRGGTLSDKSVRNALGPLAACLATAKREGLVRENPVIGAALPHRPRIEEDEELPRPFPGIPADEGERIETMELVVELVHPNHRLMFELLAVTGLRRSEVLALEVRHLALDSDRPRVMVRQRARWQKSRGRVVGPLKSRHARRDLPISPNIADRLQAHTSGQDPAALVFASPSGTPYDPAHLHRRVLAPACEEAGVGWAGFHTFRHTVASRLFAEGRNAVQVQRWLGHHSPSFTLDTYVHLLDGDLGAPLMAWVQSAGANKVQTRHTPQADTRDPTSKAKGVT